MQKRRFSSVAAVLLLIFPFLPAGFRTVSAVEPPKNPNSAKSCAICHYRWIDTFFVEGKGTDLVPYQSEKVAAKPEMCFSCHDGSVLDSRARLGEGNAHRTDAKPPPGMTIPPIFPLDDDGKVQCATCHTAHGVESGPGTEETIFLRVSNRDSAMCRMCHPDKTGGPAAGNHTLALWSRKIPRDLKIRGAHEGSGKNQIICETCHTAHGAPREGYLVKGAGDSGLCLDCHEDMNMFDRSGQRNANHAINVKPRTATIAEALHDKGAKLGYDGIITCQTCHKIHNNTIRQPALLMLDNRQTDLCLTCHPDKQRLKKTKHNLALTAKEERNLQGETVAESGMCSACHLPHKAARKPFRKTDDTDRTTALCMSCHASGQVAENEKLEGYSHPVGVQMPEAAYLNYTMADRVNDPEKESPFLPLLNDLGITDRKGKITCATCHDTHGGAAVQDIPLDGNGPSVENIKNTLLRKPSPDLCRACHNNKFSIERSRHDFTGPFRDDHAILQQKVPEPDLCQNCHRIHSREPDGFVWGRSTAAPNGVRVYDPCTRCHDKDGLAPGKTVMQNSHPVNVTPAGITGTADLPLFTASGKITDKGIMTCYTCHDAHSPTSIRTSNGEVVTVDGLPVNRFLRIDVSPESDLCIHCHGDKADVRHTDHNLLITAPGAKNSSGKTPYESGICGTCHLVHNSRESVDMWAQVPGTGDSIMDRMCTSCHSEKGAAANKVPMISTHPETLIISTYKPFSGKLPGFPIFNKTTGRLMKVGNMSCPSCHDAHHWGGDSPLTGSSDVNREGDASTSFLRPHVPDRICKQCHGIEGLFVYKYFHKEAERKKIKQPAGKNP